MVDDEDKENAITAPCVIREATFKDEKVGEDFFQKLPYGVKLTGADKLHAEGLTGKGVRVAVIDSGVDGDHPGFHDMVKEQVWFRYGSPLSKDDRHFGLKGNSETIFNRIPLHLVLLNHPSILHFL